VKREASGARAHKEREVSWRRPMTCEGGNNGDDRRGRRRGSGRVWRRIAGMEVRPNFT